jgi:hypothetical protein
MSNKNSISFNGTNQYFIIPYIGIHTVKSFFVVLNFTTTSGEINIINRNGANYYNGISCKFVVYQNQ